MNSYDLAARVDKAKSLIRDAVDILSTILESEDLVARAVIDAVEERLANIQIERVAIELADEVIVKLH